MPRIKDITGQRFGNLTVVAFDGMNKRREATWKCICTCGNEAVVTGHKLRSGWTKSCGCLQEQLRKSGIHKTHGMTNSKLYVIWQNMKHRCNDPNNNMFQNYGGRGIMVWKEWMSGFEPFLKWANETGYRDGLSIERIDVNGDYTPDNCKWITKEKQYLNRTDSHRITAFGKTQTIKEWADESGLKYDTIERRINQYGWSPEEAVTIKPHQKRQ